MSSPVPVRQVVTLVAVLVVALAAVLAVASVIDWRSRRAGMHAEQLREARRAAEHWKGEATKARAAFRVDTVRLAGRTADYRARRDTLVITDTVQVAAVLEAADSTIAACESVVLSCTASLMAADSVEAALRRQNEALKRMVPGRLSRAATAAKWAIVGGAIVKVLSN